MIDLTRLASAVVIAAALAMPGAVALADGNTAVPMAASQGWWSGMRAGMAGLLDSGITAVQSLADWLAGTSRDDGEDVHGLLNFSDKEFRDFEAQVRATGYILQGYSLGLERSAEVELVFDFERMISDRERAELRAQFDRRDSGAAPVRRDVLLALLDATRYTDASPASGYRLAGVVVRLGSPLDVRVKFQRIKP